MLKMKHQAQENLLKSVAAENKTRNMLGRNKKKFKYRYIDTTLPRNI